MIQYLIKKFILQNFLRIDLSGTEQKLAEESFKNKFIPTIREAIITGIIITPAILFLNTSILISILVPITMVIGTAWFAVSVSKMKKKFADFAMELTTDMFKGFVSSIIILGLLAIFSLTEEIFMPLIIWGKQNYPIKTIASFLGIMVVTRILWHVFVGALKFDINDIMLTGQQEVAEKYFKKSLSLLHQCAENLRAGKELSVANYYLGVSFCDVFKYIQEISLNETINKSIEKAEILKNQPEIDQKQADEIAVYLIENFLSVCKELEGREAKIIFKNIRQEILIIKQKNEEQKIVDTRFSFIFDSIAELLDLQGEKLFL